MKKLLLIALTVVTLCSFTSCTNPLIEPYGKIIDSYEDLYNDTKEYRDADENEVIELEIQAHKSYYKKMVDTSTDTQIATMVE